MKKYNSVKQIVGEKLCSGCGACSYTCNHIKMEETNGFNVPNIDEGCKNCGNCLKVCPSINNSGTYFKNSFFKALNNNKSYIAYATDNEIRQKGASGGVITAILLYLLETNKVDGCIVAYSDGKFENTKAIIATTKEEIINSQSSKYMPISMCSILKSIDKTKKYVFVGKGCDIKGLSLLQKKYKSLATSIILKIGLMCAGSPSLDGSKNLYNKMTGKDYDSQKSTFFYRYKGWPGNCIATYENEKYEIPYSESWCENLARYCNKFCSNICINHLPEDADIVIGDAWYKNKKLIKMNEGYSLMVICNEKYEYLLKEMPIYSENCTINDVKYSQEWLFNITRRTFVYDYFISFFKNKNYLKPQITLEILRTLLKINIYHFIKFFIRNRKYFK